jgi:AcrR family transcriptional regulator
MSSDLASLPRRIPRQERGERRVAALLAAAASVIADAGYEGATMSAIAERAGASIGSLYQFFPNKESITLALRTEYCKEIERLWAPLGLEATKLTVKQLVDRLIDAMIEFIEGHAAFLPLLEAPNSTKNPMMRRLIRERVAGFYLARKPRMSKAKGMRFATVTLQVIKALNTVYAEVDPQERVQLIREFKAVLVAYLTTRI